MILILRATKRCRRYTLPAYVDSPVFSHCPQKYRAKISIYNTKIDTLNLFLRPQRLSFTSLLTDGTILVKLEQLLPFEPSATRQAAEPERQCKVD